MPEKFESHASVQGFHQNFKLYGTDQTSVGNHETASFGNKINDLSFWFGINRLENRSQPLDFSFKPVVSSGAGGTSVTGAYEDISEKNARRLVFGATNINSSTQTNIKFKATYDFSQTKLNYTIGIWDSDSKTDVQSYIKNTATSSSIYAGDINFNGVKYKIDAMNPAKGEAFHIMQALDLKSDTKGFYDWQFTQ
jgi:iron complex outermembrane receptor protein